MARNNVYNNELIGVISIISILEYIGEMQISKAFLIYPFVAHQKTLSVLKDGRIKINSIEQFIVKHPECFNNFNGRFSALLIESTNAFVLLQRMDLIEINAGIIRLKDKGKFSLKKKDIGERGFEIVKASKKLAEILNREKVEKLYLHMRVEL